MKIFQEDGFIVFAELDVPVGGGVQFEYQVGKYFYPCCIMPSRDERVVQDLCDNHEWNLATHEMGFVSAALIQERRVFWNWQINFDGIPEKREQLVRIRVSWPGGSGRMTEYAKVAIETGDAVFLRNWHEWSNVNPKPYTHMRNWRVSDPTDVPPGWYVASDEFGTPRLCAFGKLVKLPPVSYCPHLSGRYDLYICFRECFLECVLHLPNGVEQEIIWTPMLMPTTRFVKELKVGNYMFSPEDEIKISPRNDLEKNPLCRFGDIVYLKLLPNREPEPPFDFVPQKSETVCYTEPYSMCYAHNLQDEAQAEQWAAQYRAMGVDTIVAQTARTGSRAMHYSKVCGWISEAVSGDDRQSSNGVSEAMARMDVMKVWGEACRRNNLRFIVNIGLNSPYPGSSLNSVWMDSHPEFYHPYHRLFLDFSHPEVIDYAAEQFREVAEEYDIDGLSVGCNRYPCGVRGEEIVSLFQRIVSKIGWRRRRELEMNIVVVANLADHYEALEQLLKENMLDSVYVGNLNCTSPIVDLSPYRQLVGRYSGKRLLGVIDAWEPHSGSEFKRLSTRTAEKVAKEYFRQGADGLFFYQGEQIVCNPLMCRFIRRLKRS